MKTERGSIVEILRSTALDNREIGWLSDMVDCDLEYDPENQVITVNEAGSIDLNHLSWIIRGIVERTR